MKILRSLQTKSKRIPKTSVSTATSQKAKRIYRFGSFTLNEAEQQLLRNGEPVRLAPKAFDVLLVLIQNRGSLVTKEELLEEVWPDAFVEEANLSVNVASLRKAVDEGNDEWRCIETVPKRGYRFVAPVSEVTHESSRTREEPGLSYHRNDDKRTEVLNSVAVLPFTNEGCGSAGDYLALGLMESITNHLSRLRGLQVMARHTVYSCHQPNMDPREVGHKLGVRSVLAGRILALGDELIIRTELVDVIKGWQLWGEQYQTRDLNILIVQQELATEISEKLKIRLSVDRDKLVSMSMDRQLRISWS
ncbi:MAG TPA: winged helix-turn-helix domain-containing protein [Pyrinomonadaceae bacterium]|nr:winged helix-turn-helix domain-containing protein [Pyrinomonadaceae bacterium]